jgi:hypothetical protein
MARAGGVFTLGHDNAFMTYRGERRLGGIAATGYLGASIQFHMAGDDNRWITRDLLWLAFDFAFNQLGVRKVLGPLASTNDIAMAIDLRAGFELDAVIRDAVPDGHLIILSMTKEKCRWLNYRSGAWRSNHGGQDDGR